MRFVVVYWIWLIISYLLRVMVRIYIIIWFGKLTIWCPGSWSRGGRREREIFCKDLIFLSGFLCENALWSFLRCTASIEWVLCLQWYHRRRKNEPNPKRSGRQYGVQHEHYYDGPCPAPSLFQHPIISLVPSQHQQSTIPSIDSGSTILCKYEPCSYATKLATKLATEYSIEHS